MAFLHRVGWCGLLACAAGCGLLLDSEGGLTDRDGAVSDSGTGTTDGEAADAGPPMECTEASECRDLFGEPPCGAWECRSELCAVICPDCTDGDLDGYGAGAGCAGVDCDDANRAVGNYAVERCYEGPDGTNGVGACASGVRTCTEGTWTSCVGQVLPTAGEACNGEDDDCNGTVDDVPPVPCGYGACAETVPGCTSGLPTLCTSSPLGVTDGPDCNGADDDCDGTVDEDCGCVWAGVVGAAAGPTNPLDPATPFSTIQAAITYAATTPAAPKRVCVMGDNCSTPPTPFFESITMADGVSVHGSFAPVTGVKCAQITTQLLGNASSDTVVSFPSGITGTVITELADMVVEHGRGGTSIAAISVAGARGVRISNVRVGSSGAPSAGESTAIDVSAGGEAIVSRSRVNLYAASARAYGIRARDGARVEVRDNCDELDAEGRCTSGCVGAVRGILGRLLATTPSVESYGVSLENAPGSVVDASLFCGNPTGGQGASVRITGDASGVLVSRSRLDAWGAATVATGLWASECGGAAPRIVENTEIGAESPGTHTDGVHAEGDCHPVIDGNPAILGHLEGRGSPTGVHCTGGSQCFIRGNGIAAVRPGTTGAIARAIGVHCSAGSCARIEKNFIQGVRGGEVTGLLVEGSAPLVDANRITGGCGGSAFAVRLVDAPARLSNNLLVASHCTGVATSGLYVGLDVLAGGPGAEPDVHSNILDGEGQPGSCTSVGLRLESSTGTPALAGSYRSNAIRPGLCDTAFHVLEVDENADPRVFAHNALDTTGKPFAYQDEGTDTLSSESDVDDLSDTLAHDTLDLACDYVAYPNDVHLVAGSLCIDAGDPTAAPPRDMDLERRDDATPDIGPDEHRP